jgi:anti-sigma factor RsiW
MTSDMSGIMGGTAGEPLSCEQFEARLGEYLEGGLGGPTRHAFDRHLAACVHCAALVADLRRIEAEAAALPELVPSRDLWGGIAARLETPVVPIGAARRAPARPRYVRYWMGAAAAAGLVFVTATVTYQLTRHHYEPTPSLAQGSERSTTPTAAALGQPDAGQPSATQVASAGGQPDSASGSGRATQQGTVSLARNGGRKVAKRSVEEIYGDEIRRLRGIVDQRRTELDPKTIAVIEHSLAVIDEAIAQSRAALARDPRSRFLNEQLTSALNKKVELLRTAAMLPART